MAVAIAYRPTVGVLVGAEVARMEGLRDLPTAILRARRTVVVANLLTVAFATAAQRLVCVARIGVRN